MNEGKSCLLENVPLEVRQQLDEHISAIMEIIGQGVTGASAGSGSFAGSGSAFGSCNGSSRGSTMMVRSGLPICISCSLLTRIASPLRISVVSKHERHCCVTADQNHTPSRPAEPHRLQRDSH